MWAWKWKFFVSSIGRSPRFPALSHLPFPYSTFSYPNISNIHTLIDIQSKAVIGHSLKSANLAQLPQFTDFLGASESKTRAISLCVCTQERQKEIFEKRVCGDGLLVCLWGEVPPTNYLVLLNAYSLVQHLSKDASVFVYIQGTNKNLKCKWEMLQAHWKWVWHYILEMNHKSSVIQTFQFYVHMLKRNTCTCTNRISVQG